MPDGELALLRALGLKGMADTDSIATHLASDPASTSKGLSDLVDRGLVDAGARHRLTDAGRARLDALLAEERAALDAGRLDALRERFGPLNARFKQAVSAYQLAPQDVDAQELAIRQLRRVDGELRGLLEDLIALLPRLGPFADRFAHALEAIVGGDLRFIASPLVDSYHTAWFELHEELIGAAGRSRAEEEALGQGSQPAIR